MNEKNTAFKLEFLFTNLDYVLDFLNSQELYKDINFYYKECIRDLASKRTTIGNKNLSFLKERIKSGHEHLENILFIVEQIAETQLNDNKISEHTE